MALFIETRADEHGARCYDYCVIEGSLEGKGEIILPTAPSGFVIKWPIVEARAFVSVSEEAGPARILEGCDANCIIEMDRLIEEYSLE